MIPDNVEKIIMTKEDYDRNVEQLLYDKINIEQELERLKIDYQQANDIIVEQNKEIEKLKQELEEEKEERDYYKAIVEHWE